MGVTEATFAFSGNISFFILLSINYGRGPAKLFTANLTNLGGIVSTPADFSILNSLSIFLTSCSDIVNKEQVEFWGGFKVVCVVKIKLFFMD